MRRPERLEKDEINRDLNVSALVALGPPEQTFRALRFRRLTTDFDHEDGNLSFTVQVL